MFLDMNGTFMFGHDRFDEAQDFFPAYQAHGGRYLVSQALNAAVRKVVDHLDALYQSEAHNTSFPQVIDVATAVLGDEIDELDLRLIEKTIASHESGHISDRHVNALTSLAQRFDLYVLSNLWSQSDLWRACFTDRLGSVVFAGCLFSSDIGIVKPARAFFERAIALAGVHPDQIVMVGDDVERDIRPAKGLGMATVLISPEGYSCESADSVVPDITQLI